MVTISPWNEPDRSTVDPSLHVFGVAVALEVDPVRGRGDLLQVFGREMDLDGSDILLQARDLGGARDRHDRGVLRQ
jgi:hypothetical protein